MDLDAILKQLRAEREQLEEAILAMERMQMASGRRRGRPPAWLTAMRQAEAGETPRRRGRKPGGKQPAA